MTPAQILHKLHATGVNILLAGETIRATPREALTDPLRELIRENKTGLRELLRLGEAFTLDHGAALAAEGWQVNPNDPGLLGALQGGGRLDGIQPWRIVFRGADGTRRALLRSGRWLGEEDLTEMEQEEFYAMAGRFLADGLCVEEADAMAAGMLIGEVFPPGAKSC